MMTKYLSVNGRLTHKTAPLVHIYVLRLNLYDSGPDLLTFGRYTGP